ncbi:hypothetical protein ACLOJK_005397 [Asimina triloba]
MAGSCLCLALFWNGFLTPKLQSRLLLLELVMFPGAGLESQTPSIEKADLITRRNSGLLICFEELYPKQREHRPHMKPMPKNAA